MKQLLRDKANAAKELLDRAASATAEERWRLIDLAVSLLQEIDRELRSALTETERRKFLLTAEEVVSRMRPAQRRRVIGLLEGVGSAREFKRSRTGKRAKDEAGSCKGEAAKSEGRKALPTVHGEAGGGLRRT